MLIHVTLESLCTKSQRLPPRPRPPALPLPLVTPAGPHHAATSRLPGTEEPGSPPAASAGPCAQMGGALGPTWLPQCLVVGDGPCLVTSGCTRLGLASPTALLRHSSLVPLSLGPSRPAAPPGPPLVVSAHHSKRSNSGRTPGGGDNLLILQLGWDCIGSGC